MTALQAEQQVVGVEEADSEWIQTDATVSFAFVIFTRIVLQVTRRSPLALVSVTPVAATVMVMRVISHGICRNLTWRSGVSGRARQC
jgi:hypothetical protein